MMGVQALGYTESYAAERRRALGKITDLYKKFQTLAAHPGRAHEAGPLFLKHSDYIKSPDQQGGILGDMVMEHLLTPVFTEVANDYLSQTVGEAVSIAALPDVGHMVESASAYHEDQHEKQKRAQDDRRYKKGAGKGTNALIHGPGGEKKASALFQEVSDPWMAFRRDQSARLSLESGIAGAVKDLEHFDYMEANFSENSSMMERNFN